HPFLFEMSLLLPYQLQIRSILRNGVILGGFCLALSQTAVKTHTADSSPRRGFSNCSESLEEPLDALDGFGHALTNRLSGSQGPLLQRLCRAGDRLPSGLVQRSEDGRERLRHSGPPG